jgi:hypothetical protein
MRVDRGVVYMDSKILYYDENVSIGTGNFSDYPYKNVIIETNDLQILHKSLGLTIDIPFNALCKIETIEINGIKFVREN